MEKQEINWYAEEAATFGDRLAGAREASGMTQAQLAKNSASSYRRSKLGNRIF